MINKTKACTKYIWNLTLQKIFSIRMLIVLIVLYIFRDVYIIRDLRQFCMDYDCNMVPIFIPFLVNCFDYIFVFGFCILYLFSDIPFMNRWEMYYINRIGRKNWIICKIISLLFVSAIFMCINYIMDLVMMFPYIDIGNDWDRLTVSLANGALVWDGNIFSPKIINFYSPVQIGMHSYMFGSFIIFMIANCMFAISITINREIAILFGGMIATMPIAAYNSKFVLPYIYFFSPLNWISVIDSRFAYYLPNNKYVISIIMLCLVMTVVLLVYKINNKDFVWGRED